MTALHVFRCWLPIKICADFSDGQFWTKKSFPPTGINDWNNKIVWLIHGNNTAFDQIDLCAAWVGMMCINFATNQCGQNSFVRSAADNRYFAEWRNVLVILLIFVSLPLLSRICYWEQQKAPNRMEIQHTALNRRIIYTSGTLLVLFWYMGLWASLLNIMICAWCCVSIQMNMYGPWWIYSS